MSLQSYPDIDAEMMRRVLEIVASEGSDATKGESLLFAIYWWRGSCAARAYTEKHGSTVSGGIFAGMRWPEKLMPGKKLPTLLGTFEHALQPEIVKLDDRRYDKVINIGCGVGEYAVGFALRWPRATIFAHDINEESLALAQEIADLNGVGDRIRIGGLLDHNALNDAIDKRTFVFCDIEGNEDELLDPDKAPNLKNADIAVEIHETFKPGLAERLTRRFSSTHQIALVERWQSELTDDSYFMALPEIDRIVATCELRDGPTPWAVMKSLTMG